jgi:Holliday junction DNA helicase RuvA
MYNYIIGKITDSGTNRLVVENNGIGYELGVSNNTLCNTALGEIVKIYTYLYVREDTFALYGFSRVEEKNLFLRLIDISGVGPKMAMQILSGSDLKTLSVAIATGDVKTLCKIKGLGKKTAELIILSLREQIAESIGGLPDGLNDVVSAGVRSDGDLSDAVFALEALGVSKTDAVKAVTEAAKNVSGVDKLVAYALKLV